MKHYIHCHQGFDLNKGGTVGYLSGLLDSMEQINKFDGEKGLEHAFLFPDISSNDRLKNPVHLSLKENTPFTEAYDLNEYSKYRQYQDWFHSIIPEVEALKINIKKITSIHIHGAYNFLPAYNFLRSCGLENKVVKILTTHNPWKPEHEDLFHFTKNKTIEQLEKQKANIDAYTHFLKLRDKYAFSMCDALFFPTKHSMDGYYESWPEFSDIIKNKPVYFSLTGTEKKDVSIPKDLMRDYLGIPREAKVLLYMGRFIPMRGYDLYVTAAKKILENEDNVWFLAVGQHQEKPSLKHNRWIEVEHTPMPGNYINMADACVMANRGSYFDLSMIEVLSLGVPLICAKVGGYKYLEDKAKGAFFFEPENVDELISTILNFIKLDGEQLSIAKEGNQELYQRELTSKSFAEGYINTIDKLYDDFEIKPQHRNIVRVPFEFPDELYKGRLLENKITKDVDKTTENLIKNNFQYKFIRFLVKKFYSNKLLCRFDRNPKKCFESSKKGYVRLAGKILFK